MRIDPLKTASPSRVAAYLFRLETILGIRMNYYQFNIGDYTSHTTHLEPLEDLAFRRLLDFLYLHEKPLPSDLEEIAKLIRMRTHSDCIAYVLKEYFTLTDDGYINNRATSEILTFQEKSAKASASAQARWDKNKNKNKALPSKNKINANALRTECEGNAIQETRNKKQETNKELMDFDTFWKDYPNKKGNRDLARNKWKSYKITPSYYLETIKPHFTKAYKDTEKRFIPHGSTYVNQKRWNDEIDQNKASQDSSIPASVQRELDKQRGNV